nr:MAG TPA: adenine-specific methyltransferase [Caudoviricetes sp.]
MTNNKGYLTAKRDAASDECLTPRYVVEPIIKYLKQKGYKKIWCPFDLDHSLYVRILKAEGFEVINTHIKTGGNFFEIDPGEIDFDCIVSNPPFTQKDKIIERLYAIGKPFAILLPQNSLQSKDRTPLFIKYGLEYLGFDKRACFYTNDKLQEIKFGSAFASGYFCKNVLPDLLRFEYLHPQQESYNNFGGGARCKIISLVVYKKCA